MACLECGSPLGHYTGCSELSEISCLSLAVDTISRLKLELAAVVKERDELRLALKDANSEAKELLDQCNKMDGQLARAKECFFEITNAWNLQLGDHVPNIRVRFDAEWTRRVIEGKE